MKTGHFTLRPSPQTSLNFSQTNSEGRSGEEDLSPRQVHIPDLRAAEQYF
jgi:hypothetical protein